jgi:hypothetical protein
MRQDGREAAVARAVARIAELNAARDDAFQDAAMGEVRLAQDAFRADTGTELPAPGTDPLLDALMELTRSLDASPEAVAVACDAALEAAGVRLAAEARAARDRSR